MTAGVQVLAVVPAAGRSRRMGTDKLLLPVKGRPMLRSMVETLAAASVTGIVVVTRTEIQERLDWSGLPGVRVALNDDPAAEMIDSVRIGLRTWAQDASLGPDDGFLVCPADLPGITSDDFEACLAVFRREPNRLVMASYAGRRGHPLIFPAGLAVFVHSTACDGGLHALPRSYPDLVTTVACASPGVTQDVDGPEAYKRLIKERPPEPGA